METKTAVNQMFTAVSLFLIIVFNRSYFTSSKINTYENQLIIN